MSRRSVEINQQLIITTIQSDSYILILMPQPWKTGELIIIDTKEKQSFGDQKQTNINLKKKSTKEIFQKRKEPL